MSDKNSELIDNLSNINDLLEKENKRLEILTAITDSFLEITKDTKELQAFVCNKLRELSNDLVVICLISADGKKIDNTVSSHTNDIIRSELSNLPVSVPFKLALPVIDLVNSENFSIPNLLSEELIRFLDKHSYSVFLTVPVLIGNKLIGSISLCRTAEESPYSNEDQFFLQNIANLLASIIRNSRLLNEKETLLSETRHRVKNNLQVVSSILSIQSDYIRDQDSLKLFINTLNRIRVMSMIHENHYRIGNSSGVAFDRFVKDLVIFLSRANNVNVNHIKFNLDLDPVFLSIDKAITCGLIINELISNALKHAFPCNRLGNINVNFMKSEQHYQLIISDDGIGFPETINFESSETFGLLLVNTLIDQLNGTLEFNRTKGSEFIIRFPHNSD